MAASLRTGPARGVRASGPSINGMSAAETCSPRAVYPRPNLRSCLRFRAMIPYIGGSRGNAPTLGDHKMSLLEARKTYKPFEYPWAYEFWKRQQQIHWMPEEVPL